MIRTGSGITDHHFNPRLREGGDIRYLCVLIPFFISIHASAKEATRGGGKRDHEGGISIHASAKEATTPPYAQTIKVEDFNPRLREGGDKSALWNLEILPDFNPRLREGGDGSS